VKLNIFLLQYFYIGFWVLLKMRKTYRVYIFLIIYIVLLCTGIFYSHRFNSELSNYVFEDPRLSIKLFLDDFIVVHFSCSGNNTQVNFVVIDEYNNIWHNSTAYMNCNSFNEVNLQGSPQDYVLNREYMVFATFNNQTINSGYFEIKKQPFLLFIKNEIASFFSFMIYQNRLARGSYCDRQRMLWVDTNDMKYGKSYILCHGLGLISTFNILLAINIVIWVGFWIYKLSYKKK